LGDDRAGIGIATLITRRFHLLKKSVFFDGTEATMSACDWAPDDEARLHRKFEGFITGTRQFLSSGSGSQRSASLSVQVCLRRWLR